MGEFTQQDRSLKVIKGLGGAKIAQGRRETIVLQNYSQL